MTCSNNRVFTAQPRGKDSFIIICDIPEIAMTCVDGCPRDVIVDTKKRNIKVYRNSQITVYLSKYDYTSDILLTFDGKMLSAVAVCAGRIKPVKIDIGAENEVSVNSNIQRVI